MARSPIIMLFYGDPRRLGPPAPRLQALIAAGSAAMGRPLLDRQERHKEATRLLIDAGELTQGVLDAAFEARGFDDRGALEDACAALMHAAARVFVRSCRGEAELGWSEVIAASEALGRLPLPEEINVRVPEGYAFYALYPEMYVAAAEELAAQEKERGGELCIFGLRSIGASLAAVVAAASGARRPALTLRPVGHPFERRIAASDALRESVLAGSGGEGAGAALVTYAIADEGPGLSGSSFAAAARWLEEGGVDPARIVFLPSHAGDPGAAASDESRSRWRRARKVCADFEKTFLRAEGGGASRLAAILQAGVPAPIESIEDIAGGRWRSKLYRDEAAWPPAWPAMERRKYLVTAGGRSFLAKFEGLGRYGDAALDRAEILARAHLIPPVMGLCHGFLIGPWLEGARPLGAQAGTEVIAAAATHIAFLARELPASAPGAAPAKLLEMARYNAGIALGEELAGELDRFQSLVPRLTSALRPVATDNKLHAWEWLVLPDGRLLKADAIDHHAGHDLVGAQDIAWDVAGASIELGLSEDEEADLATRVARSSPFRPDPLAHRFYKACYASFQIGAFRMASGSLDPADVAERSRIGAAEGASAALLRRLLTCGFEESRR